MSLDNVIANWYFNDLLGHKGKLPSPSFGMFYMKALMDVVAADGVISDEERKWVVGFAAIWGYSDEFIKELQTYTPEQSKQGVKMLETDMDHDYVKLSRLSLIYNAFRAAGADGEVHEKEAQAIAALGSKLSVTDQQIQQVRALYDDDVKLRKKRAATLVPKQLTAVLNEMKQKP